MERRGFSPGDRPREPAVDAGVIRRVRFEVVAVQPRGNRRQLALRRFATDARREPADGPEVVRAAGQV